MDKESIIQAEYASLPLFTLTAEDAQIMAEQMELEPLTDDQIRRVRKGVESGLDGWSDVLEAAIREVS